MADNRNPLLRKAFEEAAKIEINELPEEKLIVRPYSQSHQNKMNAVLIGKVLKKKRINIKRAVAVAIAVVIAMTLLSVGVSGVVRKFSKQYTFSEEWRESLKENILNAGDGEGVKEFDAEYEKSTDPFAIVGRETGAGNHILLDYSQSIEYYDVIAEDEGFRFELTSITKAKQKSLVMTGGRLADGTATYEYRISEGYYAIIEISRCDGAKFSQNEKDTVGVEWSFLIAGYSPSLTNLHFRGNTIHSYCDDYKAYYAIEITEMMPFAGTDLALTAIGFEIYGDCREINNDTLYADDEGNLELLNEDEYLGVLLRFSVPEEFASDDEHYAEKYFGRTTTEFDAWMHSYQTNAVE